MTRIDSTRTAAPRLSPVARGLAIALAIGLASPLALAASPASAAKPEGNDRDANEEWVDSAVRACSSNAGFCQAIAPKEIEE